MRSSLTPHPQPSPEQDSTDGWIESAQISPAESFQALVRRRRASALTPRDRAARARASALLMHMSILCGFPIFLFALFTRDDAFVLHHAKAAGAGFVLFYASLIFGILWSPLFFWVALALYVPSLVGVWRASAGQRSGLFGLGLVGEVLFFPFQPKVKRARLGPGTPPLPRLDHDTTGQS